MAPSNRCRSTGEDVCGDVQIEFRLVPKENRSLNSDHSMDSIASDDLSTKTVTAVETTSHARKVNRPSARVSLKHKAKQHRQLLMRFRNDILNTGTNNNDNPPPTPLRHARALTVNPSLSSPQRRRHCQQTLLSTIDEEVELSKCSSTSSTSTGYLEMPRNRSNQSTSIESVVIVTKRLGNVLVLEAEGGNAVEAVSIRSAIIEPNGDDATENSDYLTYTERLLQDDISFATTGSDNHDTEETRCADTDSFEQKIVSQTTTPLEAKAGSTNTECSSDRYELPYTQSMRANSDISATSTIDRYSVLLGPKNTRASSDPGVHSERLVGAVPFGLSASCSTVPVPIQEFFDDSSINLRQESCHQSHFGEGEDSRLPLNETSRHCSYYDDESAISMLAGESNMGLRSAESDLSHLVSRGQSNISATTYGTEEDDWKELYRSFDLESARSTSSSWASHMSSFGQPLNIPVGEELKAMAADFAKDPAVLMKWLNPTV